MNVFFLPFPLHLFAPSAVLYREFFTPIVNGYIWRGGLAILLFSTAWILRHNRKAAETYGAGLVMLGMLRAEDVPKLRSPHRMGWLLYALSLVAIGWLGYHCYEVSTPKPAVEDNPLKSIPAAPRNPLSHLGKSPLAPGRIPAKATPPPRPRTRLPRNPDARRRRPGSPYAPMRR